MAVRKDGTVQFTPDAAAIDRIGEIAAEVHESYALPVAVNGLAIVLRNGNEQRAHWDVRFAGADVEQPYIPATALKAPNPAIPPIMTKRDIALLGRPVLEMSVWDVAQPFGPPMIARLTGASYHPNQARADALTMASLHGTPWRNAARVRASHKVIEEGLEPFVIQRRSAGAIERA